MGVFKECAAVLAMVSRWVVRGWLGCRSNSRQLESLASLNRVHRPHSAHHPRPNFRLCETKFGNLVDDAMVFPRCVAVLLERGSGGGDHGRSHGGAAGDGLWVERFFGVAEWSLSLSLPFVGSLSSACWLTPFRSLRSLSDATLASLPPIYGLYSCLVPISLYVLTGTSREMSLGPVAVNALLLTSSLYPAVISLPQEQRLPTYLALVFATTLLTGIFSFAMGLLRLGLAVTFVGPPVMEGFTMGSIILIGLSQLEPLLGYSTGPPQPYIIPQLIQTFSSISKTQPAALIIGLASIAILLTMGRFKYTRWIPRPLFVTVVMTLISWGIHITQPTWGLPIVGEVPRGLPRIVVPVLNSETLATCAVPAILLAVLGFMQSFAVAIRYSEKRGYPVLPNQELMALGVCHIFSSFTQSLDATGSYSRTAVKANAGAKTQVTGLVELVILLLTLFVLTPLFYYIPKSALAAIVMSAVINMFEPSAFRKMLRAKPRDFWVAVLTAVITVFASSQYGLLAGVAISLLLIVWRSSHPPTAELGLVSFPMAAEGQMNVQTYRNVQRYPEAKIEPGILVWRFDAELWFANVSYFREKLQEALAKRKGGSKGAVVPPVWEQREEVVVDTTTGSGAGEVDGEQGDLGLGITVDNTNNGTLPAPKPAAAPPIVVVDDHKVRVLVLDLSSVNDVDSSGAQALLALNTTLRKSQGIEILFAGVKGPVRDVLWRATGGRILPEGDGGKKASEPTKKKGSKKADSSTSPTATNGGAPASSSNQPPTEPELLPDEPPLDGAVPVIALEDLHGNITVVPHPAPETLTMPSGSPELPHGHRRGSFFKKNLHMVPNNTVIGAGWMQPVATTGLYVEQFFLNVAGAVEFAKKIVQRQKAKELKAMREEV